MSEYKNNGDETLRILAAHAGVMAAEDAKCERGYAYLGRLLLEVSEMRYWKVRYDTWGDYLQDIGKVVRKTPGQLKQYVLTVRDLMDTFTPEELEKIGITKAMRLRTAKDYALVLPDTICAAALDPNVTVRELKKIISTTLKMPNDPGDWMDLECEFMVTPEQRATLEKAIDIARHTEPLTKDGISKSAQMLDIMLKFAQEFLGAHFGDGQ
jgi:hypothetical protein